MEGDRPIVIGTPDLIHFNPLPPHGGRLLWRYPVGIPEKHFNPLPPHGGRQTCRKSSLFKNFFISIHSLRMEGDFGYFLHWAWVDAFQSTPSAWRETIVFANDIPIIYISIHSLRMEGDEGEPWIFTEKKQR